MDVTRSAWLWTLELANEQLAVRLGFNYVKGFSQNTGQRIVAERNRAPFASIDELQQRVPELSRSELRALADLVPERNWKRQTASPGRLVAIRIGITTGKRITEGCRPVGSPSPLRAMNSRERLETDFEGMGLSIGAHPMRFHRDALTRMNVVPAARVKSLSDGNRVRVAGAVICRQQPGTAKSFVFLSLEDETGIANIIVKPDVFARLRVTILSHGYLLIDGTLQNQRWGVAVKACAARPFLISASVIASSHDFH